MRIESNRKRALAAGLSGFGTASHAAVPSTINFQGRLADSAGKPIKGTVSITFSIYNVPSGGSALWTETQSVLVSSGVYTVAVGGVNPLAASVFSANATWKQSRPINTSTNVGPAQWRNAMYG